MPEIVEANLPQAVLLDKPLEVLGDVVGPQKLSHLIDTDVVKPVLAVGGAEQAAVRLLLRLLPQEQLFNHRQQRQRPDARLGLEDVLAAHMARASFGGLDDLVPD